MRFIYTKGFAAFFVALVVAVAVIFLHYKGWLDGLQRTVFYLPRPLTIAMDKAFSPVKTFFSTAFRLKEIVTENKQKEEENIDLKNQLVLLDATKLENEVLRKELDFKRRSGLALESCAVMGQNPTGIIDTIIINCGKEKGASEGLGVASKGYLVGKIIYAAENFSTVQLVINSNFTVDARLSRGGRLAIVRGSFNSGLLLDQVSQDEPLEKGMLVVTAGANDKISKNLLIGEVSDILSESHDLFKKASLISPIDFGNLEFVFLVK